MAVSEVKEYAMNIVKQKKQKLEQLGEREPRWWPFVKVLELRSCGREVRDRHCDQLSNRWAWHYISGFNMLFLASVSAPRSPIQGCEGNQGTFRRACLIMKKWKTWCTFTPLYVNACGCTHQSRWTRRRIWTMTCCPAGGWWRGGWEFLTFHTRWGGWSRCGDQTGPSSSPRGGCRRRRIPSHGGLCRGTRTITRCSKRVLEFVWGRRWLSCRWRECWLGI